MFQATAHGALADLRSGMLRLHVSQPTLAPRGCNRERMFGSGVSPDEHRGARPEPDPVPFWLGQEARRLAGHLRRVCVAWAWREPRVSSVPWGGHGWGVESPARLLSDPGGAVGIPGSRGHV